MHCATGHIDRPANEGFLDPRRGARSPRPPGSARVGPGREAPTGSVLVSTVRQTGEFADDAR